MVSEKVSRCRRVCVVGAGPSGLVAARELRKEGHSVVVLEQNHDVGGQWLYDHRVEGEDAMGRAPVLGVHSSIYSSLRLTSPREIMGYSDFPFLVRRGRDARRFPGHRELLLYLRDFCDWFGLRELVRFDTRVDYVGMAAGAAEQGAGGAAKWVVRSTGKTGGKVVEETYDAVVVAIGHYSQPWLPKITGMEVWKRRQMHSHVYRVPDPFRNEVVVVVGNSLSGQDISIELVDVAKEVHLSAKSLQISEGLSKVINKCPNLHIHLQGYKTPSLFLNEVSILVIGFPFFESQAKWIAQVLSGRRALPSRDDMMKSVKEFYQAREAAGIPQRNTHDIADFEYCDRYAEHCDFPHLEEWRKQLCLSALRNSDADLEGYRDRYDDEELLQEAYQSAHFTQFGPDAALSL
ncbi:hypothetical protein Taro_022515 [Colocasia esculenta]|uniref:Flavin-containing monooxygenase n=1 Tax=Colocasia esculenta TaxID=4460 RepID=A0A843V1S0_COLES|nr:hypothetical protein [Colocasia esculenta]